MKKFIKETEEKIRGIRHDLENLEHPEEKYHEAVKEYHRACMEHADDVISIEMELQELHGQLTKPLHAYAKKRGRYQSGKYDYEYSNKTAERIRILTERRDGEYFGSGKVYAYQLMQERKDKLENFNGIKTRLENELAVLTDELRQYQELQAKKDSRTKPKKEKTAPAVFIPYSKWLHDRSYFFNPSDFEAAVKSGIEGITFILGNSGFSVSGPNLRAVISSLKGMDYSISIDENGLLFKWSTGRMRFTFNGIGKWYDCMVNFNKPLEPLVDMAIQTATEGFIEFPETVKQYMKSQIEAARLHRKKINASYRCNRERAEQAIKWGRFFEAIRIYKRLHDLQRLAEIRAYLPLLMKAQRGLK